MTIPELLARPVAEEEAARQYARAVEHHFDTANRLVAAGKPDAAEDVARAAVAPRIDARYELRVER